MGNYPHFVAHEVQRAPSGRFPAGTLFVTSNEIEEVYEQGHWSEKVVVVEGLGPCTVLAVERFMHAPPWRPGERIGLIVHPHDDDALSRWNL